MILLNNSFIRLVLIMILLLIGGISYEITHYKAERAALQLEFDTDNKPYISPLDNSKK